MSNYITILGINLECLHRRITQPSRKERQKS